MQHCQGQQHANNLAVVQISKGAPPYRQISKSHPSLEYQFSRLVLFYQSRKRARVSPHLLCAIHRYATMCKWPS